MLRQRQRAIPAGAASDSAPGGAGGCPAALLASLVAALSGCLVLLLTAVCLLNARQRRRQLNAARHKPQTVERQQRSGGQVGHYECAPPPIDDADIGWPPSRPQHWPLEGAITAPRGRCTERRLKRRRVDVRRSFSAGSLRCGCAERDGKEDSGKAAVKQREKVNVSIVRVPAEENIYSEPRPHWDVAPTMV